MERERLCSAGPPAGIGHRPGQRGRRPHGIARRGARTTARNEHGAAAGCGRLRQHRRECRGGTVRQRARRHRWRADRRVWDRRRRCRRPGRRYRRPPRWAHHR
ncbi:MAG: hypothetical protein FJ202_08125 [Gemmatimonadetes bacterium]|nr:hypothetical protein [Gemmatimonadota bacterium]